MLQKHTIPANTRPPTVPWEPIDPRTIRDNVEICSGVIPSAIPEVGFGGLSRIDWTEDTLSI